MTKPLAGKKRKEALERLGVYGITQLPETMLEANGRLRLTTREAWQMSKRIGGVKSIGVALTDKQTEELTIEGSEILKARENTIELTKEQEKDWLSGKSIRYEQAGSYVLKAERDWLGSGKARKNTIRCTIPGWRRNKKQ